MRKIVLCAAAVLGLCSATFAQVLPKNMMKNTSWIGFGKPLSGDPCSTDLQTLSRQDLT